MNEYEHTLKYLGSAEPRKPETKEQTTKPVAVAKVGNDTKHKVDAREELIAQTGISSVEVDRIVDEAWDDPGRPYEEDSATGDGMMLGVIAIGTLFLISMGGAMAAI